MLNLGLQTGHDVDLTRAFILQHLTIVLAQVEKYRLFQLSLMFAGMAVTYPS